MKTNARKFMLTVAAVIAALLVLAACAPPPVAEQPPVVAAPSVAQVQSQTGYCAVSIDGTEIELPAVASNGRALCATPDGGVLIACVRDGDTAGGSGQETVLAKAVSGLVTGLSIPAFSDVGSAAYSPTGRFLAILDVGETATLYLYDSKTARLYNMGEEGLGATTAAYCWDAYADVLYSLSGDGELTLKKTDPREEAMETVEFLEEKTVAGGCVGCAGEELYFSDSARDEIYRYNFHTGEREFVTEGTQFRLSPDAVTLAVARPAGEGESTDISLYDSVTGQSTLILEGSHMTDMDYDPSGALYIAQGTEQGGYKLKISVFTAGELSDLCLSRSDMMIAAQGALYLPVYLEDAGYVTYQLDTGG